MRSFNDKNRNRSLSGLLSILFVFSLVLTVYAGNDQDLINAASNGDITKVNTLLVHGANSNSRANDGTSALMFAAVAGYPEVVKVLLTYGADVNASVEGYTALMGAAAKGYPDIVKILLAHGADINIRYRKGVTILMLATAKGYPDIVKILLAHGADVNARSNNGKTALMLATAMGHPEIVKLLKKAGAKE